MKSSCELGFIVGQSLKMVEHEEFVRKVPWQWRHSEQVSWDLDTWACWTKRLLLAVTMFFALCRGNFVSTNDKAILPFHLFAATELDPLESFILSAVPPITVTLQHLGKVLRNAADLDVSVDPLVKFFTQHREEVLIIYCGNESISVRACSHF